MDLQGKSSIGNCMNDGSKTMSEANPVEIAEDEASGDKTTPSGGVATCIKPVKDKKESGTKEVDSKPLEIANKSSKIDDIEDFLKSMEDDDDDDHGDSDMKLLWDENEGDDDQTCEKLEKLLNAPVISDDKPEETALCQTNLEEILGSDDKVAEVREILETCQKTRTKDLINDDITFEDSKSLNTIEPGHDTAIKENIEEVVVEPSEILMEEEVNTPHTKRIDLSLDNSAIAVNKRHGLTKPNFMIEIPTQELINCDDISLDSSANTDTPQNISTESIEAITVSEIVNDHLVTQEQKGKPIEKVTKELEAIEEVNTQDLMLKEKASQEPEIKDSMVLDKIEINQISETTDIILEPDSDVHRKTKDNVVDTTPNADLMEIDIHECIDKNKEMPMDLIRLIDLKDLPLIDVKNITSSKETNESKLTENLDNPQQSIDISEDKELREIKLSITYNLEKSSEVSIISSELSSSQELKENKCDKTEDDETTKVNDMNTEKIKVQKSFPNTPNASKDQDESEKSTVTNKSAKVDEKTAADNESDRSDDQKLKAHESANTNTSEFIESVNVDEELTAEKESTTKDQNTKMNEGLITEIEPTTLKENEITSETKESHNQELTAVEGSSETEKVTASNDDTKIIKDLTVQEKSVKTDGENNFKKEPALEETAKDSEQATGVTDKLLEAQPSTSMAPDGSDDEEVTDTLGLLAESSRVVEDDEEQEEDDEADDDDDFDADEDNSSNLVTAEHSEDSNHHQSETDMPKDVTDDAIIDKQKETEFQFNEAIDEKEQDGDMEDLADESTLAEANEIDIVEHSAGDDLDAINESIKEDDTTELTAVKTDGAVAVTDTGDVTEAKSKEPSELLKLLKGNENEEGVTPEKKSPSKLSNLRISQPSAFVNIVDLDESSSDDEVPEKKPKQLRDDVKKDKVSDLTEDRDKTSTSVDANTSELSQKDDEINGLPKTQASKTADTCDVTNKVTSEQQSQKDVAEEKIESKQTVSEVYNLDSDNEDSGQSKAPVESPPAMTAVEQESSRGCSGCINYKCMSAGDTPLLSASAAALAYYNAKRRRRPHVCAECHRVVTDRTQALVEGVKNMTPLLDLEMCRNMEELVEISDSDSDDDCEVNVTDKMTIGESTAEFLKENLVEIINETWCKYDMDARLLETQESLECQINGLEIDCKEIDSMLNECQVATDKLRKDLYATFEQEKKETPGIHIYDTGVTFSVSSDATDQLRFSKRKSSTGIEPPAKRTASSVSGSHNDGDGHQDNRGDDDNVDVCVVKLSGESAPAGLPPPGEAPRPPLRPGVSVYAMRNAFGAWLRATVLEVQAKGNNATYPTFTVCKVKFEHKSKNKVLPARCLAYEVACNVRLTIGTRVIALFKDDSQTHKKETYYSGIVAEIPNPVNNYRYLVFFDDGYAQYVQHKDTRLVCECSPLVWEEVHPFSRQFVREYLIAYPERPMVRLHANQTIKTEWNGKWWVSKVMKVDASLVQVHFEEDDRSEWIYRGSTRLAPLYLELKAAERHRARPLPRSTNNQKQLNMPYVEYTRTDEQGNSNKGAQNEELRRQQQRAVAKKSTAQPAPPQQQVLPNSDSITSRVVYYTPKNAVRPHKMVSHTCGPRCVRSDVLKLKELRTYNPLAKPLLSGWERQLVRFKGQREVMYRAPCGRRLKNMKELHYYLNLIQSEMSVDLFDFGPNTHCLAEFVLNKCLVSKKDLSHGKERVPVPCVNYYDDSLPEFCSYNTERTPTAGVPLNLDPEFLCGCDCTDDCQDRSKCACWALTFEGARTIGLDDNVGYVYKRLPEPLPSGIYECNSRCKCKQTCLNRVAQHPLQLKLQVFKTLNRGWGIRALNDVPKGAFLCVYAGNLLTDATANLDGLNEGDEYLAELDYIEVVEQMKEGFEEDIPDADKELDKESKSRKADESDDGDDDEPSSTDDEKDDKGDKSDGDFKPDRYVGVQDMSRKTLRKREKKKEKERKSKAEDDCITISDDEELREPSRFMADAEMKSDTYISKYKSVRTLFGKDEACYIMDAKVQGNIGRYLNHSCSPNVFVQNVFVDSHDPRFPWVAFFASCHIKAGTELTWNYNYDVGSVPGKVLYCYCGAPNCRRRLL